MAVQFKDYYAILGVARDATDEDIKQAFRKLARKYHPDVAADKKSAEEKFKEINEAHEVLGDPAKRKKYDELGARWQEEPGGPPEWDASAGRAGRRGRPRGRDFHFGGTGFSDFFEQFFGGRGFGAGRGSGGDDLDTEAGPDRGADIEGDILVTLSEVMHGTTRPISLQTTDPRTGETETHAFRVRIPPGAEEGRRIRVPGKGGAGAGNGTAGDLYLRVKYAAHPDFTVRGGDLYCDLDLTPWDAVLGTEVQVPTLASPLKLRIPPGTAPGRQFRMREHGLVQGSERRRGDLYAVAHLRLPDTVSADERALWEQLRRLARAKSNGG